ncbi:aminoglycoside phosphotransferase family protein [Pedococcus dokdonensis]|nr:aminoglycoside phosphotransferase family protein [Pedococcus dokdonensis]
MSPAHDQVTDPAHDQVTDPAHDQVTDPAHDQVSDRASEAAADLGPAPQRLTVTVEDVSRLVAGQFPQWSHLPVAPVVRGGWDNVTFHLGDDLLVRLPSATPYSLAVEKEHRWLPALAAQLPVRIPTPRGLGRPTDDYPLPWSVYGWIAGTRPSRAHLADPVGLADDLAGFLVALRAVDPTGGPRPGVHNWYRGGSLRTFDDIARRAMADLDGELDVVLVTEAWEDSLAAPWDGVDTWFHGDVADGNLLVDEQGRLVGVIDFGTCGVGDPSCDLAIAWTLLDKPGRRLLRDRLAVDDASWARGRGWALWKALQNLSGALADGDPGDDADDAEVVQLREIVTAIVDDYSRS